MIGNEGGAIMTKRERFLNFLANKPVDRVPVAFFHHFIPFSEFGMGIDNDDVFERNISGHAKAKEIFDPDMVKIMSDSLFFMPVDTSMVECAADLRKIKVPTMDSPFVRRSIELTRRIRAIYDADMPVIINSCSPTFVLRNALCVDGMPNVGGKEHIIQQFIREDPLAVADAANILADAIIAMNDLLIRECGVDGIYLSVNNQNKFFDEKYYTQYMLPCEKRVMDEANKLCSMNLLHICGMAGRSNNLNLFTGFEAAAYNWAVYAEGVSLREGKKLFGGKPVFGGFSQYAEIYKGTREELEAATFAILEDAGQVGIMLGADCTVPADIDDNRLEWVRQAAVKYAQQKA